MVIKNLFISDLIFCHGIVITKYNLAKNKLMTSLFAFISKQLNEFIL